MSLRELSNIGYIYQDEQDWANGNGRPKRSSRKVVAYKNVEPFKGSGEAEVQGQTVEHEEQRVPPSISAGTKTNAVATKKNDGPS
jgi:hypothetical protein